MFAVLAALSMVAYGVLVGVLGRGPDGLEPPIAWRLFGYFIFFEGCLSFVPNTLLIKTKSAFFISLLVTSLPVVIVIIAVITAMIDNILRVEDLLGIVIAMIAFSFAPFSLLVTRRDMLVYQRENDCSANPSSTHYSPQNEQ